MPLLSNYEYGYAQGQDTMLCIRREGQDRMLCGRVAGFVPAWQPEAPQSVHRDCLAVMYQRAVPRQVQTGICPACEGRAPVVNDRIEPHGVFRMSSGQLVETSETCAGVNMRPKR